MLRSHGLVREIDDLALKKSYFKKNKDLNPQFIFALPGLNVRNNELGAILGINQLKRLDKNIKKRNQNHIYFLNKINKSKFHTDFDLSGRGSVGGGNQLRQPYLKEFLKKNELQKYPITEHVHFFGFYLGNYPDLSKKNIDFICKIINET